MSQADCNTCVMCDAHITTNTKHNSVLRVVLSKRFIVLELAVTRRMSADVMAICLVVLLNVVKYLNNNS